MEKEKIVLTIDGKIYPIEELENVQKEYTVNQYDVRVKGWCSDCGSDIIPYYAEPIASCDCCDREWYE